jgi:hypothetical protein
VTRNQVFPPGDVAEGGVKSASAVGPEEVAEMVAEVEWEGGHKINIRGDGGAPSTAAAPPLH